MYTTFFEVKSIPHASRRRHPVCPQSSLIPANSSSREATYIHVQILRSTSHTVHLNFTYRSRISFKAHLRRPLRYSHRTSHASRICSLKTKVGMPYIDSSNVYPVQSLVMRNPPRGKTLLRCVCNEVASLTLKCWELQTAGALNLFSTSFGFSGHFSDFWTSPVHCLPMKGWDSGICWSVSRTCRLKWSYPANKSPSSSTPISIEFGCLYALCFGGGKPAWSIHWTPGPGSRPTAHEPDLLRAFGSRGVWRCSELISISTVDRQNFDNFIQYRSWFFRGVFPVFSLRFKLDVDPGDDCR